MLTRVYLRAEQCFMLFCDQSNKLSVYTCLEGKWGVSPLTCLCSGAEAYGVGSEGGFCSLPLGTALDDGEKRATHPKCLLPEVMAVAVLGRGTWSPWGLSGCS